MSDCASRPGWPSRAGVPTLGPEYSSEIAGNAGLRFGSTRGMLAGMNEKAIRRAALITLRRAILERFPPGAGAAGAAAVIARYFEATLRAASNFTARAAYRRALLSSGPRMVGFSIFFARSPSW